MDRMNMLNFTPIIENCISYLRLVPEVAPTDRRLVAWVELQRLSEEVTDDFRRNKSGTPSFNDAVTQDKLKSFGMKFEEWVQTSGHRNLDGRVQIQTIK